MSEIRDVIIDGSGPAGYTAAICAVDPPGFDANWPEILLPSRMKSVSGSGRARRGRSSTLP
jgi:hypothetical protein